LGYGVIREIGDLQRVQVTGRAIFREKLTDYSLSTENFLSQSGLNCSALTLDNYLEWFAQEFCYERTYNKYLKTAATHLDLLGFFNPNSFETAVRDDEVKGYDS
jgi:hypothetical protein